MLLFALVVSLDCDLLSLASVICIVEITFYRLTVDMIVGLGCEIALTKDNHLFCKAFATGIILAAFGMLATYPIISPLQQQLIPDYRNRLVLHK